MVKAPADAGAGVDDDIVPERRVALLLPEAGPAERHAVKERGVLPDFGRLTDDQAHAVADEQPRSQLRRRMDLDARQEAAHACDRKRAVTSQPRRQSQ